MLTSLHIQEFKGLRDINIPELRKVNLILGGQNVGKTSLLEAIVFVAGEVVPNNTAGARHQLPRIFRVCEGNDAKRFWNGIFGTRNAPTNVMVTAIINSEKYQQGGFNRDLDVPFRYFTDDISLLSAPDMDMFYELMPGHTTHDDEVPHPFPTFSKAAAEQVELYGRVVTSRKKKTVLRLLKKVDTRVESIEAGAPDGDHRVYVELVDHPVLLPLSGLGHGFTRLFELYAGLAVTESKLALIDEIENGIHYSALPTLFEGVRELSESNGVQSIITTHSLECIKSAYEVFEDKLEDFQMIRLERSEDGSTRAVVIADENLKTVMEAGWEIR